MRVKLKNIKYSEWNSDETANFQADVYFDNKKVGFCSNDGHGGSTYVQSWGIETKDKYKECEEYCKSLPPIKFESIHELEGFELDCNIENICDMLFENWLKEKDRKKMEKDFEKGICYGSETHYQISEVVSGKKKIKLKDVFKDQRGIDFVKKMCEEKKRLGHKILNTNLPFEV